jgi:hypothetical protein
VIAAGDSFTTHMLFSRWTGTPFTVFSRQPDS